MAAQKSILNSQELREAMTVSEDENDKDDDNEDDSSEDKNRNDRPTDSNNAIPKESPLPSPKSEERSHHQRRNAENGRGTGCSEI